MQALNLSSDEVETSFANFVIIGVSRRRGANPIWAGIYPGYNERLVFHLDIFPLHDLSPGTPPRPIGGVAISSLGIRRPNLERSVAQAEDSAQPDASVNCDPFATLAENERKARWGRARAPEFTSGHSEEQRLTGQGSINRGSEADLI